MNEWMNECTRNTNGTLMLVEGAHGGAAQWVPLLLLLLLLLLLSTVVSPMLGVRVELSASLVDLEHALR